MPEQATNQVAIILCIKYPVNNNTVSRIVWQFRLVEIYSQHAETTQTEMLNAFSKPSDVVPDTTYGDTDTLS